MSETDTAPTTTRSTTAAWVVLVALVSGGAGYRYAAADWSGGLPDALDTTSAAVALGASVVASTLRVRPWVGPLAAWAAFGLALALTALPLDDPSGSSVSRSPSSSSGPTSSS